MAKDKVRLGFVGVGGMGQCAHLKNYAAIDSCEVVALAEVRPDLGNRVAAKYGIPHVYSSHAEMLDAERLDGLVASQPFSRHGQIVPELMKAGVPIFIEKPLACSIESAEKILAAKRKTGVQIMVGYNKRSDPATIYAKAEIDRLKASGDLGCLTCVRIVMPPGDWIQGGFDDLVRTDEPVPPLAEDRPAGMSDDVFSRYKAFVNYYIHQVNLMRHLLGEPYTVSYAHPSGRLLAVTAQSGAPGVIEMATYNTTVGWQESAFTTFEKGFVRLDMAPPLASNRAGRVEVFRDPGQGKTPETLLPDLPRRHSMRNQAAVFLNVIRGETAPPCGPEEALEDLKVARRYIELLTGC
ncbi:MAG: Gfo/Idh/MocA family oxidoreductase [Planctomycetes bacterium]|nr:Gfo/Idh/MocA family oxidoreductase [Planctomycetota bacterium]